MLSIELTKATVAQKEDIRNSSFTSSIVPDLRSALELEATLLAYLYWIACFSSTFE